MGMERSEWILVMEERKAIGFGDWLSREGEKEKRELGMTSRCLLQVNGYMFLPVTEIKNTKEVHVWGV